MPSIATITVSFAANSSSICFFAVSIICSMGLPLEIISWGSMLSLSEKALLTDSWWIIIIPGAFLVTLLMCLTNIGNYLRKAANRKESNL